MKYFIPIVIALGAVGVFLPQFLDPTLPIFHSSDQRGWLAFVGLVVFILGFVTAAVYYSEETTEETLPNGQPAKVLAVWQEPDSPSTHFVATWKDEKGNHTAKLSTKGKWDIAVGDEIILLATNSYEKYSPQPDTSEEAP